MTGVPVGAAGETDPLLRLFPGALSIRSLTDADIARLDAGSARRGSRNPSGLLRSSADEQQLQALVEWLQKDYAFDLMGVVTFSDRYAARNRIYGHTRALQDVWHGLKSVPMNDGRDGWPWEFIIASEWHRTGREVPHVHVALATHGRPAERLLEHLRVYFDSTRGRSRFEVMRDTDAATLYGLKDTAKSLKLDPDALRLRLWCDRRRPRSSGYEVCGGGGGPAAFLTSEPSG